jgi:hypothetical protein
MLKCNDEAVPARKDYTPARDFVLYKAIDIDGLLVQACDMERVSRLTIADRRRRRNTTGVEGLRTR